MGRFRARVGQCRAGRIRAKIDHGRRKVAHFEPTSPATTHFGSKPHRRAEVEFPAPAESKTSNTCAGNILWRDDATALRRQIRALAKPTPDPPHVATPPPGAPTPSASAPNPEALGNDAAARISVSSSKRCASATHCRLSACTCAQTPRRVTAMLLGHATATWEEALATRVQVSGRCLGALTASTSSSGSGLNACSK